MRTVRNQAYSDAFESKWVECLGESKVGKQNIATHRPWFQISCNLTVFQTRTKSLNLYPVLNKPHLLTMHITKAVHINQNMEKEKKWGFINRLVDIFKKSNAGY